MRKWLWNVAGIILHQVSAPGFEKITCFCGCLTFSNIVQTKKPELAAAIKDGKNAQTTVSANGTIKIALQQDSVGGGGGAPVSVEFSPGEFKGLVEAALGDQASLSAVLDGADLTEVRTYLTAVSTDAAKLDGAL